jgi:hypothetical protein
VKLKPVPRRQQEFRSLHGASRRDAAALAAAASAIARIEAQMSRPPRIAVMGEFNTGKSSLINLLVGCKAAPAGILTRTLTPCLLRPGEGAGGQALQPNGGQEILLARDILRRVELLDTPATDDAGAADWRSNGGVASLSSVHGVIWCTLAAQAWKASERREWLQLPSGLRRRGALVVTHADSLRESADRQKVLERLREEAGGLFDCILFLSITEAMRACDSEGRIENSIQWRESGAEAFNAALSSIIDGLERLRSRIAARAARRVTESVLNRLDSVALGGKPSPKQERL